MEANRRRGGLVWVVFVCVLAIVVGLLLQSQGKIFSQKNVYLPVQVLTWHPSRDVAKALRKYRIPVVLKDTGVTMWHARNSWNPKYLIRQLQFDKSNKNNSPFVLPDVRNRSGPLFFARSTRPDLFNVTLLHEPNETGRDYTIQNMDIKTFFMPQNEERKRYYYYSGMLDWWPPKLRQEVEPLHFLELDPDVSVASVWLAHPHVTAQCHLDRSYNLFVNLYGRKRWTLFPPEKWQALYVHPHLHPNYHQSQVVLAQPDFTKFPLFSIEDAMQVILEPGDVLFVPPYWFHQVESLDEPTIALSVVSPSEEEILWNKLKYKPLPFIEPTQRHVENEDLIYEKVIAAKTYIYSLLISVITGQDPKNFVKDVLIQQRYAPLIPKLQPLANQSLVDMLFSTNCFSVENNTNNNDEKGSSNNWRRLVERYEKEVWPIVDVQADVLNQAAQYSDGVAVILLANHIEEVANKTVGLYNVLPFLQHCFG